MTDHIADLQRRGMTMVEMDGVLYDVRVILVTGGGETDVPYLRLSDAALVVAASRGPS